MVTLKNKLLSPNKKTPELFSNVSYAIMAFTGIIGPCGIGAVKSSPRNGVRLMDSNQLILILIMIGFILELIKNGKDR